MLNEDEVADDDNDNDNGTSNGDAAYARKVQEEVDDERAGQRSSKRLASTYDQMADLQASAAEREKRQISLMDRRNEERVRELARAKRGKGKNDENRAAEEVEAYKRTKDYPDNVLPNQIKVDMANKCVILPIGGNPVPFHISTIKAAVYQKLDSVSYLRVNFYAAGLALGKEASRNMAKLVAKYAPYATFIREMTFRSLDGHNLNNAYRMIMELRKRFRAKEIQELEEATLVKQDRLIRTKNERVPRLSDLTMRPVFAGRKTQGNLEAHQNGMRFISNRGETVDIIYSNIKHAVFQPCENEIMVLIHFHLKDPIMIGKKKQTNVQVFTEVIDASQAVDAGRRNMYDPEEMDDEQRERQLRKKLNEAFKDFCRKVEKVASKNGFTLEFDIPYRDLGFQGNPHKEMVFIMPTLNCLCNLTETPFFVVDLNGVDHVHFERVTFASKAFDIVLVNKDFTKQPWRVDMIPNTDKDAIQDWLTDMEISYTEGPMNLNWKQIMGTVAEDDRFYMDTEEDEVTKKEAGWSFLRMFGEDDEDDDDSAEGDSDFGADDGAEGESEEEEEEEEFDDESEEESDFDGDEELEEQGLDWEDMEREAIAEDRKKGRRDEGDNQGIAKSTKKRRRR
jgi:nucleosome binding factor SPN SPT16 subunit